jgi:hypothetical protein
MIADLKNILNVCENDKNHYGILLKETFDRKQKRRKEEFDYQNLKDV